MTWVPCKLCEMGIHSMLHWHPLSSFECACGIFGGLAWAWQFNFVHH